MANCNIFISFTNNNLSNVNGLCEFFKSKESTVIFFKETQQDDYNENDLDQFKSAKTFICFICDEYLNDFNKLWILRNAIMLKKKLLLIVDKEYSLLDELNNNEIKYTKFNKFEKSKIYDEVIRNEIDSNSEILLRLDENAKSFEFLKINDDNKIEITENVLEKIRNLKNELAIISIAGAKRNGKSFFLNNLLSKELFKQSDAANPCTNGMWIILKESFKKDLDLLIIDTEGLDDINSDSKSQKLFIITIIISSMIIYNTKGVIDTNVINKLATSLISCNQLEEINEWRPNLFWLIRDMDKQIDQLLPKNYVDSEIKKDSKTHSIIKSVFKNINSWVISPPNRRNVHLNNMKSLFKLDLEIANKMILNTVESKKSGMNGQIFAELLKKIIDDINDNNKIKIDDSYNSAIESNINHWFKKLYQKFKSDMNEYLSLKNDEHIISDDDFENEFNNIVSECRISFEKKLKGIEFKKDETITEFMNKTKKKFLSLVENNQKRTYRYNESLLNKKFIETRSKLINQNSMSFDIKKKILEEFLKKFNSSAKGNSKRFEKKIEDFNNKLIGYLKTPDFQLTEDFLNKLFESIDDTQYQKIETEYKEFLNNLSKDFPIRIGNFDRKTKEMEKSLFEIYRLEEKDHIELKTKKDKFRSYCIEITEKFKKQNIRAIEAQNYSTICFELKNLVTVYKKNYSLKDAIEKVNKEVKFYAMTNDNKEKIISHYLNNLNVENYNEYKINEYIFEADIFSGIRKLPKVEIDDIYYLLFNLNEYGKRKFKQLAQAYFQTDELVDKLIRDSEKVGTNFNDISERKNWINENEGTLKNLTWYCIKGNTKGAVFQEWDEKFDKELWNDATEKAKKKQRGLLGHFHVDPSRK